MALGLVDGNGIVFNGLVRLQNIREPDTQGGLSFFITRLGRGSSPRACTQCRDQDGGLELHDGALKGLLSFETGGKDDGCDVVRLNRVFHEKQKKCLKVSGSQGYLVPFNVKGVTCSRSLARAEWPRDQMHVQT